MGYTHYWKDGRGFSDDEWDRIKNNMNLILDQARDSNIHLVEEYDTLSPPIVSDNLICFNGYDKEGHETFYFPRVCDGFNFCKTAHKPYDDVVVATLVMIEEATNGRFEWTSDGDSVDHESGRAFLSAAKRRV